MTKQLIYFHDPMCSWCYGFSETYEKLIGNLPDDIEVIRVLGGLAPDSDEPMPETTKHMVAENWHRIMQQIPGVKFNFDFWTTCEPRRSTYPSCRAVIAAREQGDEFDEAMTKRIQQAYYQEARNPSNDETLIDLAVELGLDQVRFTEDLNSEQTHQRLFNELDTTRSFGVSGFPSLRLMKAGTLYPVRLSYTDYEDILGQLTE